MDGVSYERGRDITGGCIARSTNSYDDVLAFFDLVLFSPGRQPRRRVPVAFRSGASYSSFFFWDEGWREENQEREKGSRRCLLFLAACLAISTLALLLSLVSLHFRSLGLWSSSFLSSSGIPPCRSPSFSTPLIPVVKNARTTLTEGGGRRKQNPEIKKERQNRNHFKSLRERFKQALQRNTVAKRKEKIRRRRRMTKKK